MSDKRHRIMKRIKKVARDVSKGVYDRRALVIKDAGTSHTTYRLGHDVMNDQDSDTVGQRRRAIAQQIADRCGLEVDKADVYSAMMHDDKLDVRISFDGYQQVVVSPTPHVVKMSQCEMLEKVPDMIERVRRIYEWFDQTFQGEVSSGDYETADDLRWMIRSALGQRLPTLQKYLDRVADTIEALGEGKVTKKMAAQVSRKNVLAYLQENRNWQERSRHEASQIYPNHDAVLYEPAEDSGTVIPVPLDGTPDGWKLGLSAIQGVARTEGRGELAVWLDMMTQQTPETDLEAE